MSRRSRAEVRGLIRAERTGEQQRLQRERNLFYFIFITTGAFEKKEKKNGFGCVGGDQKNAELRPVVLLGW